MSSNSVRVIRQQERSSGPPTPGMVREQAVATDRMWAGLARTDPGMVSGWHHHGDYESAIYVLTGRVRVESGPGDREMHEAGPDDFIHIPSGAIHRESNPLDHDATIIVVRAGTGESVVNVDGPEPAAELTGP